MKPDLFIAATLLLLAQPVLAEPSPETVYGLKGSVVKINTVTNSGGQGVGSGVVVGKDLIATNCHVLANSNGINATAYGEVYTPVAVKEDWRHDVCILRFEYLPLKPAMLADLDKAEYEQSVFSIGFPGGMPKPLTTVGNLKSLYPLDDSMIIRTSASFIMGASGSPIFDDNGQLLGLNTVKSPGHNAYYYGVSVKWIKRLLDDPSENKVIAESGTPFWDAPEDQRPDFMRVVIPMQNKEWGDLKQIAQAWSKKEPQNAEAVYFLALAQENLGETDQAKRKYEQVLQSVPKHSGSLLGLAKIASKQGNQSEVQRLSSLLKDLDSAVLEELSPQSN